MRVSLTVTLVEACGTEITDPLLEIEKLSHRGANGLSQNLRVIRLDLLTLRSQVSPVDQANIPRFQARRQGQETLEVNSPGWPQSSAGQTVSESHH